MQQIQNSIITQQAEGMSESLGSIKIVSIVPLGTRKCSTSAIY